MNTSNHEVGEQTVRHYAVGQFQRQLLNQCEPAPDDQFEGDSATPLGQLLKLISSLPEIRHDKVDSVRQQINRGQYDLGSNLDAALDKVLEEFLCDE